jgi:hypothetical protein
MMQTQREIAQNVNELEDENARRAALLQHEVESLPAYVDAMRSMNAIDIEDVLSQVCTVVLYGKVADRPAVTSARRVTRAHALMIIADEFRTAAEKLPRPDRAHAREAMERAVQHAARKANGLEEVADFDV